MGHTKRCWKPPRLPIAEDKKAVPLGVFSKLVDAALAPPDESAPPKALAGLDPLQRACSAS